MTRFMKLIGVAAGLAGLLTVGCLPRSIEWSRDGQMGSFVRDKTLYLIEAPHFAKPVAVADDVLLAKWMPKARELLVFRQFELSDWKATEGLLSTGHRERIVQSADDFLRRLDEHDGDLEALVPHVEIDDEFRWLYLRAHKPEPLKASLKKDDQELLTEPVNVIVVERSGPNKDAPAEFVSCFMAEGGPVEARISPDGRHAAVVTTENLNEATLRVIPIRGSTHVLWKTDRVSLWPDWSHDSRFIYFLRSKVSLEEAEGPTLGSLQRVTTEEILSSDSEAGVEPEELAMTLWWNNAKVRSLPGGSVLFSAFEMKLPLAPNLQASFEDGKQLLSLFTLHPGRPDSLERLFSQEQSKAILPSIANGMFELSPSGERLVAFHDEQEGVFVYDFKEGKGEAMLGQLENKLRPAWRDETTLCVGGDLSQEEGENKKLEAVLFVDIETRKPRTISTDWPKDLVHDLLNPNENKSTQAGSGEAESDDSD